MSANCYYCGPTDRALRPYGPGGADICYHCMRGSPERERDAQLRLKSALESAQGHTGVALITDRGPIPFVTRKRK